MGNDIGRKSQVKVLTKLLLDELTRLLIIETEFSFIGSALDFLVFFD
jgi:hypothetical protein